ncbi:site-specific recombinase XerD [Paraburkholderia unamae]|uniref:phage integrase family protein n=1 Tax=Paraburkholderia unamae TaxID=219649 RepID=UPI000DC33855|nr:phage integrase family protein [Paraburkholderia unamae]RAR48268.1 site-specific recombinase XerD [Paraburkholderia unamae]
MTEQLPLQRRFSSKDFAALRAFLQKHPPATIARTYYDSNGDVHAATPDAMERYLRDMLATLFDLAIGHGSSVLADHLTASIRQHGSGRLTAGSLKLVEEAALLAVTTPAASHGIGMWFRPMGARYLKGRSIATPGDLAGYCNTRGGRGWRSVPRIGPGRARRIVAWLRRHERAIGLRVEPYVDVADPLVAPDSGVITVGGEAGLLAPLERMAICEALDGSRGVNRSAAFPYIDAHNDLAAIRAYLHLYRDQPKTLRVYTRELQRFLLWSVTIRGKALSSLHVDDCEAFKDFLKQPSPSFVGPRAPRTSRRWRPFASDSLSPRSQLYAVRALRAAFTWLVDARYLAGNPWKMVNDPVTIEREAKLRVERALPGQLWSDVRRHVQRRSAAAENQRWRIVHALMLLLGDSGLRREEAANARRETLHPYPAADGTDVWALTVTGKRSRERTVPVSTGTVDAIRAHWRDRGEDFDAPTATGPLLSPLVIPRTKAARLKHDGSQRMPYATDVLNRLIDWLRRQLLVELESLTPATQASLEQLSPHAFRHTFGTQAAANAVPIDVIQKVLGHQSVQTTSIYVQAETQRMMREVSLMFRKRNRAGRQDPDEVSDGEPAWPEQSRSRA